MEKFLSVSEYAERYKKDAGNIRRLLACGRMAGIKIGNQWAIPEGTAYPSDKRVKTGAYKNQRKTVQRNALIRDIKAMIDELSEIYGNSLVSAVLYGSYARGTQTKYSDVDIALFVKNISKDITERMIDCVSGYELITGKVLSVIDIDSEKYEAWKNVLPFYKNIEKEGIVLWKVA